MVLSEICLTRLDGPTPFRVVTGTLQIRKVLGVREVLEVHRKRGAVAGSAFNADSSAMRFDDGLDQTEAKAEAALGSALVAAEEPFPDAGQLGRRDAESCVGDAKDRAALLPRD